MNNKNRFCKEKEIFCQYANRCTNCEYYVGHSECQRSFLHGKNKDYTSCHGNNNKCFHCHLIRFERKENVSDICKNGKI